MTQSRNGFHVTHTSATTPGAPVVLMIHGFLDDATVWDDLVEALSGEVGAVRYDLPGFGTRRGSVDTARGTTLASLAAEAGAIIEQLDGPVIVVGQSLGTQVAELVAAQHQDRVHGLVLLTPVPLGGTQLPAEVLAPFAALSGDRDAQRRARAQLSPHLGEDQLDRLVDIGAVVTPGVAAHFAGLWNTGVPDAPATSAFDGPVLVIRGGADGFVTEQLVDAISSRFPDAEVQVIDKGGHWLHVEYAEKVAAMILDFADGVVGVTS
jgi:esterase